MGRVWGQMSVLAIPDIKERGVITVRHVNVKLQPTHQEYFQPCV